MNATDGRIFAAPRINEQARTATVSLVTAATPHARSDAIARKPRNVAVTTTG